MQRTPAWFPILNPKRGLGGTKIARNPGFYAANLLHANLAGARKEIAHCEYYNVSPRGIEKFHEKASPTRHCLKAASCMPAGLHANKVVVEKMAEFPGFHAECLTSSPNLHTHKLLQKRVAETLITYGGTLSCEQFASVNEITANHLWFLAILK